MLANICSIKNWTIGEEILEVFLEESLLYENI